MFNSLVRIELESLRFRQARLKDLFQRGAATAAELRQVEKDIEKIKTDAAKETSAAIVREANHTAVQYHFYSDPPSPWIVKK
ncbi:hypothetical protein EBAPG3_009340 [Nitrosospira lacus]|uniref:Uncharacterized protein n=1 Tax=Nitrosospira lacus TaxID=1288494 RepID=A0A1W6SQ80_9PROT|nr:hypothetical protein [Nitrosospira lacus]ARO87953.1 hypothetical protein EBAPG3_009340 [Nitrosospira lacus]